MKIDKELVGIVAKDLTKGDSTPFAAMRSLVADMEKTNLTGKEKKEKVLEDFKAVGYELAGWVVDTLLQLALIYVKTL